jgi:hypothetical protein
MEGENKHPLARSPTKDTSSRSLGLLRIHVIDRVPLGMHQVNRVKHRVGYVKKRLAFRRELNDCVTWRVTWSEQNPDPPAPPRSPPR